VKKLEPNPEDLLKLLHAWRNEAIKAGIGRASFNMKC
jgi:transposase